MKENYSKRFMTTKPGQTDEPIIEEDIFSGFKIFIKQNDNFIEIEKDDNNIYTIPRLNTSFYIALYFTEELPHYSEFFWEVYYNYTPNIQGLAYDANTFNVKVNEKKEISNFKSGDEYNFYFLGDANIWATSAIVQIEKEI